MSKNRKKKGVKVAKKGVAKKTAKKLVKRGKAARKVGHRPTGRAKDALERLEKLTRKYETEGLPPEEARQRAIMEMRQNPRMDWRAG
jgi:hypothetical protein